MEFKKENLLVSYKQTTDERIDYPKTPILETRAEQLFKIAEFLDEFFNEEYSENIFQAHCLWCRVQLDKAFFDKLTEASECKNQEQRMKIMQELHIYVEDFLIAYCEEFFKIIGKHYQTLAIYTENFLHSRMEREKLEKFFYITGILKKLSKNVHKKSRKFKNLRLFHQLT